MKNMLFILLLFAGCASAPSIEGIYTKHVEGEYSIGEDTAYITSSFNNLYTIDRHTGYQMIRDGVPTAKQIKLQHSTLVAVGPNQWQDTKTGTILTVSEGKLLLGSAVYQKIK